MWALLSTRLRTWLLFAIAVPIARSAVRHVARRAADNNPDGQAARTLARADALIGKLDRRKRRRSA